LRRFKKKQNDDTLVDIVEARDNASDFLENNQMTIFGGLALIVLLFGGIFAYNQFYKIPANKAAMEGISQAQFQFEQDSFALALTNPGNGYTGFLDLIDNQGGTKAGNAAQAYAAISYLQLGEFDAAISHMNNFSPSGQVAPILKNGVLGDAYSEKNDLSQAMSYYKKAVSAGSNDMLTPYYLNKIGMLSFKQKDFQASKAAFEQIKNDYPFSQIATEAEKYLSRIAANM